LGAPGSGKTTRILHAVRGHLRDFRDDFRVVVPTATMAEHLRNGLAREGFTLRANTIATVTGHARELLPGVQVIDATTLEIALEETLAAHCPASFEPTREMPGFRAQLARALEELTNAGCDAGIWQGFVSLMPAVRPLLRDLGGVWMDVQERLREHGLKTRHEWLRGAAQALRDGALPGVSAFYWDGFSRLGAAELDLVRAHGERGDVTVSLPAWPGAARGGLITLRREGFAIKRCAPVRSVPRKVLVQPATADDEAVEIARRIVEHHRAGRPWHEIGIVVRTREPYAPLLETACARFGIPLRPYFATPLSEHPVARLFDAALRALLADWNWEPVLDAVLSPAGRADACPAAGRFEYAVREKLPGAGLSELRELANGAQAIVEFLDRLATFDAWRTERLPPDEWAARLNALNALLEPPRLDGDEIPPRLDERDAEENRGDAGLVPERALESPRGSGEPPHGTLTAERISIWRARAAAARTWLDAMREAAACLPDEAVPLARFLEAVQPALRDAAIRNPEFRREAVPLIDAQEARQWELPVVFVCGLLEGAFPRAARPDPMLGEALRRALRRQGIGVRTRSERDSEERFLFDVALSRATSELVLSYPRLDEKGEATLGAFALARVEALVEQPAPPCDLASAPAAELPAARPAIEAPRLLAALAEQHGSFSPTSLETYLECPFHYFAAHTLRLEDPPPAPADRFDARERGTLVHGLLAQYHRLHDDLLAMFRKDWVRMLARLRVPVGYRLELDRILIERSLRMYVAGAPEHAGWAQSMEEKFDLPIASSPAGSLLVHGRIDRYEVAPGGDCVVYDYKFSRPSTVGTIVKDEENGRGLQAGLYLQALRRKALRPVAFYYVAIKGACETKGWNQSEDLAARMTEAGQNAAHAAGEILQGRIAVAPKDQRSCDFCNFIDACRIREIGYGGAVEEEAAGAGQ